MLGDERRFQFEVPIYRQEISRAANIALQLGALSGRLALEKRTLVNQADGRAENVSEHANMLARIAPIIAQELYPDLDSGLVAIFATIHDDIEAYVGDTPSHNLDEAGFISKAQREKEGLERMCQEFAHIPWYVQKLREYEAQEIPEARFVRVLDKTMPVLVHFNEGGKTMRSSFAPESVGGRSLLTKRNAKLLEEYPEFVELIALRAELTNHAFSEFFEQNAGG